MDNDILKDLMSDPLTQKLMDEITTILDKIPMANVVTGMSFLHAKIISNIFIANPSAKLKDVRESCDKFKNAVEALYLLKKKQKSNGRKLNA